MHSLHIRPSGIQHKSCTTNKQYHTSHEHQPQNPRNHSPPQTRYNKHIDKTTTKAHKTIQIFKALTSTTWGKQKETILAAYKAIMRSILEYISNTSIRHKQQITPHSELQLGAHLHDETHILQIK